MSGTTREILSRARRPLRLFLAAALFVCGPVVVSLAEPSAPPLHVTSADDPAAVVSDLYRHTLKAGSSAWLEDAASRRLCLSRGLQAAWAASDANPPADGDVGTIDFDLMADTNGFELQGFRVAAQRRAGATAEVDILLRYKDAPHEKPHVVTYALLREDGRWVVDEIRTKSWSLRDLLKIQAETKPEPKK